MRHYDSIKRIQDDKTLLGECVWAFNKLDGQNLGVKWTPKDGFAVFCSRKRILSTDDEQFGNAIAYFKDHVEEPLLKIIQNEKALQVKEAMYFFEWFGPNSFAGVHQEGDTMQLALIDVFRKQKGYIEPEEFYNIFGLNPEILTPELIYKGELNEEFIEDIQNGKYQTVKEGVVCRRDTMLKGQRMPKVKIKTKQWVEKVHSIYPPEMWDDLE